MAMVVQHNLTAMNSNRMLGITTSAQSKSSEKLSSGYRINRAADDAAGLTISEKMRKQVRGLDRASTNAQDGVSAVQTAEGALTEVHSMLQRMNELAVQSANGTNSESDREAIQAEIDQLVTEIDRVSETTKFNEIYLLKGDADGETTQVYSYKDVKTPASFSFGATTSLYAKDSATAITTAEGAIEALTAADGDGKLYKDAPATQTASTAGATGDANTKLTAATVLTTAPAAATAQASLAAWGTGGSFAFDDGNGINIAIDYAAATDVATKKAADKDGVAEILNADTGFSAKYTAVVSGNNLQIKEKTGTESGTTGMGNTIAGYITNDSDGSGAVAATAPTPNSTKAVWDEDELAKVELYAEGAAEKMTAEELKQAYYDKTKVFDDAATPQTEATDYTYKEASSARAVLYDENGKKVAAHMIDDILADDTKKLYDSADENTRTEVTATDIGNYTTSETVNAALKFNLHVGADSDAANKISVEIDTMSAAGIGVKGLKVDTEDDATAAIDTIAAAIQHVSAQRSALGAVQNRLEHTIANLDNVVENTTAAESRIRDTDMAEEMVEYSKNNILAQAGQSMLAQSNQSTQGVLSLLQ